MSTMLVLTLLLTVAGGPATPATDGGEADRPRHHVRLVQQALSDRGFDPGGIDGIMGSSTSAALRRFQRSERLPATGEMDLDTVERLRATGPDTRMIR